MTDELDAFAIGPRHITAALSDSAAPGLPPDIPMPVAVIYPSRTSGERPHAVTIDIDGGYSCTCVAGSHDRACWAVKATKELLRR